MRPGLKRARVAREVRPAVLLLGLAASLAAGFAANGWGIDRHYALSIAIALLVLAIRLSLRPVKPSP